MGIKKELLGNLPDGREVQLFTMENENGVKASFTDYGALWLTMEVPDRDGKLADVVLGYDNLDQLRVNLPHLGAPVGRNANRIGGAAFSLNGQEYKLTANNHSNNLHSGPNFYEHRLWNVEAGSEQEANKLTFQLDCPDGDQGYPGSLCVSVSYTLTDDNSILIEYIGLADQDTIFNMTNHSYFNLAGHNSGTILDQLVMVNAEFFTIADEESIPTGEIASVEGTPMDFRQFKPIGQDIEEDYVPLIFAGGYDHNYVLKTELGDPSLAAKLWDKKSGRVMEVYTDLPGVHLYTGNSLSANAAGKSGAVYGKRSGVCFETQFFPNAINIPSFRQPVIKAGEEFRSVTVFHFTTEE